jgi:osmotically-inducible protein OsmY
MDIREDVIRRTLWIEPDAIRVVVHDGVVMLEGQLERRSLIPVLEGLVMAIDGVVAIEARLSFLEDDTAADIPLPWAAIVPRRT